MWGRWRERGRGAEHVAKEDTGATDNGKGRSVKSPWKETEAHTEITWNDLGKQPAFIFLTACTT